MKKFITGLLFIFLFIAILPCSAQAQPWKNEEVNLISQVKPAQIQFWKGNTTDYDTIYRKGEVILKLKKDAREQNIRSSLKKASTIKKLDKLSQNKKHIYLYIQSDSISTEESLCMYKNNAFVEKATPNYARQVSGTTEITPSDPGFRAM